MKNIYEKTLLEEKRKLNTLKRKKEISFSNLNEISLTDFKLLSYIVKRLEQVNLLESEDYPILKNIKIEDSKYLQIIKENFKFFKIPIDKRFLNWEDNNLIYLNKKLFGKSYKDYFKNYVEKSVDYVLTKDKTISHIYNLNELVSRGSILNYNNFNDTFDDNYLFAYISNWFLNDLIMKTCDNKIKFENFKFFMRSNDAIIHKSKIISKFLSQNETYTSNDSFILNDFLFKVVSFMFYEKINNNQEFLQKFLSSSEENNLVEKIENMNMSKQDLDKCLDFYASRQHENIIVKRKLLIK